MNGEIISSKNILISVINIICQEGKYNQLKVEYFIYGIIKREE